MNSRPRHPTHPNSHAGLVTVAERGSLPLARSAAPLSNPRAGQNSPPTRLLVVAGAFAEVPADSNGPGLDAAAVEGRPQAEAGGRGLANRYAPASFRPDQRSATRAIGASASTTTITS